MSAGGWQFPVAMRASKDNECVRTERLVVRLGRALLGAACIRACNGRAFFSACSASPRESSGFNEGGTLATETEGSRRGAEARRIASARGELAGTGSGRTGLKVGRESFFAAPAGECQHSGHQRMVRALPRRMQGARIGPAERWVKLCSKLCPSGHLAKKSVYLDTSPEDSVVCGA